MWDSSQAHARPGRQGVLSGCCSGTPASGTPCSVRLPGFLRRVIPDQNFEGQSLERKKRKVKKDQLLQMGCFDLRILFFSPKARQPVRLCPGTPYLPTRATVHHGHAQDTRTGHTHGCVCAYVEVRLGRRWAVYVNGYK